MLYHSVVKSTWIISPEAFSQCQVASWAAAHPRWSDKSPQGRGQSWFLLFLNSCSIYHILVTRPFLAANCDSKSSSLHIARAHGGWGHQQVSNTKWLPLSFFVASFLSCLKVHGDFFYPTNAIYCQKQPRDWAVHGLIISSSASFLCCWWSAPNLSKDRLFVSEAQCVASGWGRYSEVLGINKCKRNKKLVCPCNSSCFLYCWNLQCLDGNQWNYSEITS